MGGNKLYSRISTYIQNHYSHSLMTNRVIHSDSAPPALTTSQILNYDLTVLVATFGRSEVKRFETNDGVIDDEVNKRVSVFKLH